MKSNNPLLKGGQGRDACELEHNAIAMMSLTAWLLAILLGCWAAAAMGVVA